MAVHMLLVEDDPTIREVIDDYFHGKFEEGLELVLAADGDEGLYQIEENDFDLVLLDVMLPGIDGFSLCRTLRKKSQTPIIFLTARGREEDALYGYDIGCDDYIVKPFSLATLLAKVKALLKRSGKMSSSSELVCGRIKMNVFSFQVFVDGKEVILPPKEYEILQFLMRHKGNVVTRDMLLDRLWGFEYDGGTRVLDNHMKKLRDALGSAGGQIKTVITKGYKLTE